MNLEIFEAGVAFEPFRKRKRGGSSRLESAQSATRSTRRALCLQVRDIIASERSPISDVVLVVWLCESFGALRGGQFDWIGVMARRHDVLVESHADVEAVRASERSAEHALGCGACCLVV